MLTILRMLGVNSVNASMPPTYSQCERGPLESCFSIVRFSTGLRPVLRVRVWVLRTHSCLSIERLLLLSEPWTAAIQQLYSSYTGCIAIQLYSSYTVYILYSISL